ncbi:hypothetical protein [Streptomyces sp. NPDC048644]|uniref:hypothetical protein n=1 Tax=Streptomyces sp. NPDC048644 TaxID=3365582 RepID=UPI0037246D5C
MRRLVRRLSWTADPAMPYLTGEQRTAVARWKAEAARPTSTPAARTSQTPSPAAALAPQPKRQTKPANRRNTVPDVTAAVRDVLEHAARLGKTVPWSRLCAEARGFADLPYESQRAVLANAGKTKTETRDVALSTLVVTEDGHPYR